MLEMDVTDNRRKWKLEEEGVWMCSEWRGSRSGLLRAVDSALDRRFGGGG